MPFDPVAISRTPEREQFPDLTEGFSMNHFTGQPNIVIPLYTVETHDIQVPIALKYRSGGLRVDVQDGYLGTHWDLVVGGEIRRTLVGMPDEMNTEVKGFLFLHNPIAAYGAHQDRRGFINRLKEFNLDFVPIGYVNCELLRWSSDYGQQYSDGRFDTGPDIYNFNIMGISGTFTADGTAGNVQNLQTNEWVNVRRVGEDFIIEDARGYTYIFGAREMHRYKYRFGYRIHPSFSNWRQLSPRFFDYAIAWKLTEIRSPNGERMIFRYEEDTVIDWAFKEFLRSPQSFYVNDYIEAVCLSHVDEIQSSVQRPTFSDIGHQNEEKYTYQRLTEIETATTFIRFRYQEANQELFRNARLTAIETFTIGRESFGTSALTPLTSFIFSYNSQHLTSIREYSHDGLSFKEHRLEYYPGENFRRFDRNNKDHWGFFSPGASEFASGIHRFGHRNPPRFIEQNTPSGQLFGHRNPRTVGANAGMLRRISYPTGAGVTFDWEPHDYSKRSRLLGGTDINNDTEMTDGFFQRGQTQHQQGSVERVENRRLHMNGATSAQLSVSRDNQRVRINLSNYYPRPNMGNINDCNQSGTTYCACICNWYGTGHCDFTPRLVITGPNNFSHTLVINRSTTIDRLTLQPDLQAHNIALGRSGVYTFTLVDAGRELIIDPISCFEFYTHVMPSSIFGNVDIHLSYVINPNNTNNRANTFIAGGVRIKEMTLEGNNNRIRRVFNYSLDPYVSNSPSSGVLTKAPRYGSFSQTARPESGCSDPARFSSWLIDRYTIHPNALPRSTEPTGHIEYAKVTEFITSQPQINNVLDAERGTNTRVVTYNFSTSVDTDRSDVNETLNVRYVPNNQLILTSNHFRRGNLIEKTEYTHEKRTTRFDYSILEQRNVPLIPATLFVIRDFSVVNPTYDMSFRCPNDPLMSRYSWYKDFGIVRYRIIPYNKRITAIRETGGTLPDKTRTFGYMNLTTYSNDRLANSPVWETTLDSRGNTITHYHSYTNLNQVHTRVTVAAEENNRNRIITAAHRNEYNAQGNLTRRYMAEIPPAGIPVADHRLGTLRIDNSIRLLTDKPIETRTYRSYEVVWKPFPADGKFHNPADYYSDIHRLYELTDHNTGISTVYIWAYNGAHPIAEIQNLTAAQLETQLNGEMLDNLFRSQNPDMSIVNKLREQFPESRITTFTYRPGVGVTSITDPRDTTVYFAYDNFGQLTETYIRNERGEKQIIEKTEYHWAFMRHVNPYL